jgi:hypothetical protein
MLEAVVAQAVQRVVQAAVVVAALVALAVLVQRQELLI